MLCINFGRRPDQHARFRAQWMQHQNYNFCLALNSSLTSLLFFWWKAFSKGRSPKNLSQVTLRTLYCVMFVILYVWWEMIILSALSSQWLSPSILSASPTDLQDFSAVFHRQLLISSSGAISKLCHLQRSDFSHMMYEHSSKPRPQLCETSLVTSVTCKRCPFVMTLGLLFLSC